MKLWEFSWNVSVLMFIPTHLITAEEIKDFDVSLIFSKFFVVENQP